MSDRILAIVKDTPHQPIVVRAFAVPDLPPGGALVRTAYANVCEPRQCG